MPGQINKIKRKYQLPHTYTAPSYAGTRRHTQTHTETQTRAHAHSFQGTVSVRKCYDSPINGTIQNWSEKPCVMYVVSSVYRTTIQRNSMFRVDFQFLNLTCYHLFKSWIKCLNLWNIKKRFVFDNASYRPSFERIDVVTCVKCNVVVTLLSCEVLRNVYSSTLFCLSLK